jgi:hypothetical protein
MTQIDIDHYLRCPFVGATKLVACWTYVGIRSS